MNKLLLAASLLAPVAATAGDSPVSEETVAESIDFFERCMEANLPEGRFIVSFGVYWGVPGVKPRVGVHGPQPSQYQIDALWGCATGATRDWDLGDHVGLVMVHLDRAGEVPEAQAQLLQPMREIDGPVGTATIAGQSFLAARLFHDGLKLAEGKRTACDAVLAVVSVDKDESVEWVTDEGMFRVSRHKSGRKCTLYASALPPLGVAVAGMPMPNGLELRSGHRLVR